MGIIAVLKPFCTKRQEGFTLSSLIPNELFSMTRSHIIVIFLIIFAITFGIFFRETQEVFSRLTAAILIEILVVGAFIIVG